MVSLRDNSQYTRLQTLCPVTMIQNAAGYGSRIGVSVGMGGVSVVVRGPILTLGVGQSLGEYKREVPLPLTASDSRPHIEEAPTLSLSIIKILEAGDQDKSQTNSQPSMTREI